MTSVNDDELERELKELDELRREIADLPDPTPSAAADRRFAEFLRERSEPPPPMTYYLRPRPLYLGIAASLLLVFALGWYLGGAPDRELERQLAATRTLMLELMQDQRSTTRMQAATVSLEVPVADPIVIDHLGRMLRTDENTNVRLAALDALQRFAESPLVREELLMAMSADPPPAVQVQLMETLVALNERRVLPYLEELIKNDTLPRQLRDAAELGSFKLI